ncbi:cation transporter [Aquiflexum lacus]|uniref:cation transporter n=1 Tax=Aquiflexum lacus TaxID=2483805 RepID=UPI001893EE09|nr:cation transporter [Aquiflexum lacus]
MKSLKFKTNVKCGACVAAITPEMEKLSAESWTVDLTHPERILTVTGEMNQSKVVEALEKSGYKGEIIS